MRPKTLNPFLAALMLSLGDAFASPTDKLREQQDLVKVATPVPPAANRMMKLQRRVLTRKTRKFTEVDQVRLDAAQAKRERRQLRNIRNQQRQLAGLI